MLDYFEAHALLKAPVPLAPELSLSGELGGAAARGALSSSMSSMSKRPVRSAMLERRLRTVLPKPAQFKSQTQINCWPGRCIHYIIAANTMQPANLREAPHHNNESILECACLGQTPMPGRKAWMPMNLTPDHDLGMLGCMHACAMHKHLPAAMLSE